MIGWRVWWAPYSNRKGLSMRAFPGFDRQKARGFVSALWCGLLAASLALASPAYAAGGGGGGGGGGGAGGGGGGALNQAEPRAEVPSDLTVCKPGQVWDTKRRKCLIRRSDVLPDPDMTEYAYALAKADRYQEAIDVLDLLDNPNTPRALNYRGYATRKLGRTDEGIGYYLKSVALDPNYPQVREYLGEAYVIEGKYDLAKEQLSTIEKLCSKDCEYYEDLAGALTGAHAL
jgi:tetratricopeptide (TPR) repeat protein